MLLYKDVVGHFMRRLGIILFLTVTTILYGQDTEIINKGDTTTIRSLNITIDPFLFGDNPLGFLKMLDSRVSKQTFENRHVDNKIDTVFTFTIGTDMFSVYQWDKNENALVCLVLK